MRGETENHPSPQHPAPNPPLLELRNIRKSFGSVHAVRGADFVLMPGEVHALVGENGAGKSTLMHVAYGMVAPDAGSIRVRGQEVRFGSPRDARARAIGMVHQHFTSIGGLSVRENVALATGRLDGWTVGAVGARLVEGLDLDARAETLSVAQRQRLEILKALATDAKILLLDEPTAVLAPAEVDELFVLVRDFVGAGGAVALITHKLQEVLAVSDRVTVLRRGAVTLSALTAEQDQHGLAEAMIGSQELAKSEERRGTSAERQGASRVTVEVDSIQLHAGEVVGVAAVEGQGQREILRAIAGLGAYPGVLASGTVAFVPEDRTIEGLIPEMSVTENVVLGLGSDPRWARGATLDWKAARARTLELIAGFGIVASGADVRAATLSGGNQQKLVLARALEHRPGILVLENPTRGLDLRTTGEMHRRLRDAARDGATVIVYSTDLDEVLEVAERVLVVRNGKVKEAARGAERRLVGEMMLGVEPRQRSAVNGQR